MAGRGRKLKISRFVGRENIGESQRESRESRKRMEIALEASQAGIWEIDFVKNIMTCDSMCGKLFGFAPQTKRMSVQEFIAHLERVMVEEVSGEDFIREFLGKGAFGERQSWDFGLLLADGTERYVRSYEHSIRDQKGDVLQVIGMCMDITANVVMEKELKAAKEAAENASRAKSQFLSNMSHEIRTPMNAIFGMAELLTGEALSDRQRLYVNDIKISATSLLEIINDILDFSKIEAGRLQLNPVDYDIWQLLQNIRSVFSFAAREKGISFVLEIQAELPRCLYGDDIRVRQVLVNILGNAVKFTKVGEVTLTVEVADEMLCFTVSDTGVGMKQEDIPKIFKDFNQLDDGNNRSIAGTGLGLSITKNLLDQMKGSVEVESVYGEGSTFRVRIPLVEGDETKLAGDPEEFVAIRASEAKVLVVDDNEVNLNVAAGMLRLSGIVCDTALSGQEAIDKVAAQEYDLVFMDHMMPEMDGVETTQRLREIYNSEELIIVALTANAIEGVKEMLLDAGMNDYLPKPISKNQLNQILRKWLPSEKIQEKQATDALSEGEKKPELSALLSQVGEIEGIDVALACQRIDGMQDVLEKSLDIFVRRLPEVINRLAGYLEVDDLSGFAIEVHGLKGSLHNIGAARLALEAEELEICAKNSDGQYVRDNLPHLTEALTGLEQKLLAVFKEFAPLKQYAGLGDRKMLIKQLHIVRNLLDAFEGDEALESLQGFVTYDYGDVLNGKLKELCALIEEFEYDRAMALIDKLK